jgi:glucosyl-3-phosphoglycerate synthase
MERRSLRRFHHRAFPAAHLVDAKGRERITVCIPAKDEAATVGSIVGAIHRDLVDDVPLVDEILVVDDGSTDATAIIAAAAGATVVPVDDVLPDQGVGTGKGEALWKGTHTATGSIVVFCDADIEDFSTHFVTGLVGPLLADPEIHFVKGFYRRPVEHEAGPGGRTTELVARPLLALLHPAMTEIVQPLAGEYSARRDVLDCLPFVQGYGVDIGLLIDVAHHFGIDALAQVDLGQRVHRNRSLEQLSPQALSVMRTALERAGVHTADPAVLVRPGLPPLRCEHVERPPLAHLGRLRSA